MTDDLSSGGDLNDELHRVYVDRLPALQRAREELSKLLHKVAASIEDRNLVRANIVSLRIKEFESFRSKAVRRDWTADEAIRACTDLVGARVVCSNVEDLRRFAELLKEDNGDVRPLVDEADYIQKPQDRGYRALHLDLVMLVGGSVLRPDTVRCEVQIRTLLQDAWANLVHDDIYKQMGLPEDLEARARDLAAVLATADEIASSIRSRAARVLTAPARRPALDVASAAAVSYLFRQYFGRSPADYAVRQALDLCQRLDIRSLEWLPEYLKNDGNEGFPEEARLAYLKIVGRGPLQNERVFLAALRAVANGKAKALKWIRHQANLEVEEFEHIASREMLSELPDTIEEFTEDLSLGRVGVGLEQLATAFGTAHACYICQTTIVDPYAFAEAAIVHYSVPEAHQDKVVEEIERAIYESGAETGGWQSTTLCAYHSETMHRDD